MRNEEDHTPSGAEVKLQIWKIKTKIPFSGLCQDTVYSTKRCPGKNEPIFRDLVSRNVPSNYFLGPRFLVATYSIRPRPNPLFDPC